MESNTSLVVRAFPLMENDEAGLRDFAAQLRAKRADTREFFDRFGVAHESWHLQETPAGHWAICVTEITGPHPASVGDQYAGSNVEFDSWFKGRVLALTGIDPNEEPLGPPTTCVFDTRDL